CGLWRCNHAHIPSGSLQNRNEFIHMLRRWSSTDNEVENGRAGKIIHELLLAQSWRRIVTRSVGTRWKRTVLSDFFRNLGYHSGNSSASPPVPRRMPTGFPS